MSITVTPAYVSAVLALQGRPIDDALAQAIASALAAQLAQASPTYAGLPFESEPSGFAATLAAGASR